MTFHKSLDVLAIMFRKSDKKVAKKFRHQVRQSLPFGSSTHSSKSRTHMENFPIRGRGMNSSGEVLNFFQPSKLCCDHWSPWKISPSSTSRLNSLNNIHQCRALSLHELPLWNFIEILIKYCVFIRARWIKHNDMFDFISPYLYFRFWAVAGKVEPS